MWIVLWSHDIGDSIGDNRLSGSMSTRIQKEALEWILGLSNSYYMIFGGSGKIVVCSINSIQF